MLKKINELYGSKLAASDGDIGHVKDFYFDDKTWVIRYLIADTGSWLPGRLVLLSPHAFGRLDQNGKVLPVNLTRKQIENSPSIESHQPVSRQYEVEYYRYYGWPAYWVGGGMWGLANYPVVVPPSEGELISHLKHHHRDDKHLQSTRAITSYKVQTVDGAIGEVSGLVVDDKSWEIHNLVVEAGHWYAGKEILLLPENIDRISYEDSAVLVNLSREDIQKTTRNDAAHVRKVPE
jgi:sporulation protein YlmC with PRC-barrel domain